MFAKYLEKILRVSNKIDMPPNKQQQHFSETNGAPEL
jgi:hypothetical protein